MKRLLQILRHPFNEILFRQRKYDKRCDALLKYIMDKGLEPIYVDAYTMTFQVEDKTLEIWTANFPYAYGFVRRPKELNEVGPSISMAYEFRDYLRNINVRTKEAAREKYFKDLFDELGLK